MFLVYYIFDKQKSVSGERYCRRVVDSSAALL